jgi:hypothetical protein
LRHDERAFCFLVVEEQIMIRHGKRGCLVTMALLLSVGCAAAADAQPTILRTPDRGIQPQAVMDAKGVLHLLYFKGKDSEGDLFYVRREPGQERFSEPIRVNSQSGSAIAMGSIRGGQIALGKDGRVHVAWNGSGKALPQGPNKSSPMLYSRLDDSGKTFEEQRNLMQQTCFLDGGGSVAADDQGNVYVAWHGVKVGTLGGEANRQVWVAKSTDDGKTFTKEASTTTKPTGTCGCCGMRAFVDSKGTLHMLYRSAGGGTRDMYQIVSKDKGKTYQVALLQKWSIGGCPMSSEAFTEGKAGVFAAWETEDQVYFAKSAPGGAELGKPVNAPGSGKKRKHPALANNAKGETILVWTEETDWNKGGSLAWQVFDAAGKPTSQKGRIDSGIPVWGLPTAVATPEGEFIIIH